MTKYLPFRPYVFCFILVCWCSTPNIINLSSWPAVSQIISYKLTQVCHQFQTVLDREILHDRLHFIYQYSTSIIHINRETRLYIVCVWNHSKKLHEPILVKLLSPWYFTVVLVTFLAENICPVFFNHAWQRPPGFVYLICAQVHQIHWNVPCLILLKHNHLEEV